MKYILLVAFLVLLTYVVYQAVRIRALIQKGETLGKAEQAFSRSEGAVSLLVIGDSTAVGLGTSAPEYSVAGRLSRMLDASVVNLAISGATTADAMGQIASLKDTRFDLILIQVGANDIIRFHSIDKTLGQLDSLLTTATRMSDRVVLLTAGKVGEAPYFPKPLGFLWTAQAAKLRSEFMRIAHNRGIAYVDLYTIPDPFSAEPDKYYAPDGLHLTDAGYGFWYEQVKLMIEKRWPDFIAEHEQKN